MTESVTVEPNLFKGKDKKDVPRKTRKRLWIALFLVAAGLLGYFFVSRLLSENALPVSGKVRAFQEVKVKTLTEGILKEVRVLNAQKVRKGDVLFVFQNDGVSNELLGTIHGKENLEDEVKRFEKELDYKRRQAEAAKELHEKGVIGKLPAEEKGLQYSKSQNLFAQKKRELEASTLKIQTAQRKKDALLITVPFDGIFLGNLLKRVGTFFKQGESLGVLYDPSKFYVEALVPETDARRVRMDQDARIFFKAFSGTYSGRIMQVDEKMVEVIEKVFKVKHVVKVKILLNDFPEGLRPGMRAEAKIWLERSPRVR